MKIFPISLSKANKFVEKNHRHHKPVPGCKFCLGAMHNNCIVGVAICGRPVSRYYDDGITLEINRLCTDGTQNACSFLYGACARVAKAMGYHKIITYILESENGASLRASNYISSGRAGGKIWTGSRRRDNSVPKEFKTRYELKLCDWTEEEIHTLSIQQLDDYLLDKTDGQLSLIEEAEYEDP